MDKIRIVAIVLTACVSACAATPNRPAAAVSTAPSTATAADIPVPGLAPGVHFAGGDGSSQEKAVIVLGANESSGVQAEYLWLAAHFPGYQRGQQGLIQGQGQGGKSYDVLDFTTAYGTKRTVYFDITDYFGKF